MRRCWRRNGCWRCGGGCCPRRWRLVTLVADVENGGPDGTAVVQRIVPVNQPSPKQAAVFSSFTWSRPTCGPIPPCAASHFASRPDCDGTGQPLHQHFAQFAGADLAEALVRSRAPKIYVCNLAIQPGETDNYSVADHVNTILDHIPANFLDIVLANDNLTVPPDTGGGHTIFVKPVAPESVKMITADLVDEARPWRHDSIKLAQAILRALD
jgi:hypothetical protein